jgi:hypothetical protein
LDATATGSGINSSVTTGGITTSASDLIIVAECDPDSGGSVTQAAGYALLSSDSQATLGKVQYIAGSTVGAYSPAYLGVASANWAAISMAFKPLSAGGNAFSYGFPTLII